MDQLFRRAGPWLHHGRNCIAATVPFVPGAANLYLRRGAGWATDVYRNWVAYGRKMGGRTSTDPKRVLVAAIVLVPMMAVITPVVFQVALGLGIFWRITISLLLVAPLGFVLGMPFPLGLRLAMRRSSALGSWAWGVNGFFTVIGTVLALM